MEASDDGDPSVLLNHPCPSKALLHLDNVDRGDPPSGDNLTCNTLAQARQASMPSVQSPRQTALPDRPHRLGRGKLERLSVVFGVEKVTLGDDRYRMAF